MSLPVPDRDNALQEMRDSARRLAELLRSVGNPARTAIGYWSVGEVGAHTTHVLRILNAMVSGGRSPITDHLKMAEHWDRELHDDDEREPKVLADRIEDFASRFEAAAEQEEWEKTLEWHGGIPMPLHSLVGIIINECEIHALDVAGAESKDWTISRDKALLAIYGVLPAVHEFVREDVATGKSATWQMKLRGGATLYFILRDGDLEVTQSEPARVECRISADPVQYLLVGYGRKSQWGPIVRGQIAAYGRKPWLSLTLAKLFYAP
jgi:uncharacterized protein (TIGR03083 family)